MEENNRKGPGVFYAVVGVATLVVAIIGATFAYFSASVTPETQPITGDTYNIDASDLHLSIEKLAFAAPLPTNSGDGKLVPADFGVEPNAMAVANVNGALNNKCINGGYTGCHVWKVIATADKAIANVSLLLNLELQNVTDEAEWSYVVYKGSDTAADSVVYKDTIRHTFTKDADPAVTIDMHKNAALNGTETYYVMVYLKNTTSSQNNVTGDGTAVTDARGTYTGSVVMKAMGGQIKATFAAAQ